MTTYEFKILIDRDRVKGEYGLPGYEQEPAGEGDLQLDPLTLETVGLMNRWLSFWDRIDGSEIRRKEALLQPITLEVLGAHLWRLILANEVGQMLKQKIPKEGKPALRLSIEFDENADATLKGLPWEFLFEPEYRWFLATKTELLLTRYVTMETGRDKVRQVGDKEKLRALLIAALPNDEKFAAHREALWNLRTALKDVANLEVPDPLTVWDQSEISAALEAKPYHIVHVVGICRGVPGKPEIYLGGQGDGFHDPAQFVNCLTRKGTPPRLVILQLCDYVDGDATENFERLAPALIKRRVPAVLALQYAARVGQAEHIGLGKQFYQSLIDGELIGAAVQASRRRLQDDHPDRRFGTPVLYLQEDGALRRPLPSAEVVKSTAGSGTSGALTIRKSLIDVVDSQQLKDDQMQPILGWVIDLDQHYELAEVKNLVKEKMLAPLDKTSRRVYIAMFTALGRLEQERGNGQS
ncbi:MAG: CHAT domain-containing protein [Actinomycetota bacterium]